MQPMTYSANIQLIAGFLSKRLPEIPKEVSKSIAEDLMSFSAQSVKEVYKRGYIDGGTGFIEPVSISDRIADLGIQPESEPIPDDGNLSEIHELLVSVLKHSGEIVMELPFDTVISKIAESVCSYLNVPINEVRSKSRKHHLVRARHIIIYILYQLRPKSVLKRVGEYFGGFDHTSIMHAKDRVAIEMDIDADFCRKVNMIHTFVKNQFKDPQ
jgi:hypothetical protein